MQLRELQKHFETRLLEQYPEEEVTTFFAWLTEAYLGWNRFEASLHKESEISEAQQQQFEEALHRLARFEPIQHILGSTEWMGMELKVNKHTLIPRPETETLVRWIAEDTKEVPGSILDIGTGSGCIAIALARHWPEAAVAAIDVSEAALTIAATNASSQEVVISFQQLDILQETSLPAQYDIIVSNPPYVRHSEKARMKPNVLRYEPASALYVEDEDPLLFYRKIAQLAILHLTASGALYFEINEYLGSELIQELKTIGFQEVVLRKDLFSKPRMIRCSL
ncbi:peptide chain release factor N(5)-glutamine methyltransferase [Altibacter sp. HG106]|uniref:peptide chain release factor N(5)-glutamine methyltransferase n=1 Tax=Altibacter sp. HG106 TaxID=3023937 RepID=UPI0023508D76|nr:peptide chain release factor N(5)-glutamine methyltransferase [Altibacter sp. HG106]MDC7995593.1 peptide chain release factor N(5)-glutamine methyltransferase [Altibacter sp. HG106]